MHADGQVTTTDDAEGARLTLAGRIVAVCVRDLHRAAVAASGRGGVTICCSRLAHVDAAAVQVLLGLRRNLVGRGGTFRVTGVPDALRGAFRLAGLDEGGSA